MTRLMVIGLMSNLFTALSLVYTEDQLDMFSDIQCTQTMSGDVINGLGEDQVDHDQIDGHRSNVRSTYCIIFGSH